MNYQKVNKKADKKSINSAAIQQDIMKNLNLPNLSLNRQKNIMSANLNNVQNPMKQKINKYVKQVDEEFQQIYQYNKKLTLAQKLGLVPAPEKPLDQDQWQSIEEMSLKRNDVCPICIEPFKTKDQIILSCSHVFHKQCLQSFEKHTQKHQCPVCRKIDYQKKYHNKGFIKLQNESAILIQKNYRGFIIRKYWFEQILLPIRDQIQSKTLKRKIMMYKLGKISQKTIKTIQQKQEKAKKIMDQLDLQKINKVLEENLIQLHSKSLKNNDVIQKIQINSNIDKKWIQIKDKYVQRGEKDCPICLIEMNGDKAQYLLSCSHSFHANCLNSYVWYSNQQSGCPVCRAEYEKMYLIKD